MNQPASDRSLLLASSLVDRGRYRDAMAQLGPHLATHPDDRAALCLIAGAQLGLRDYRSALVAAQTAIRLDPSDEWALRLASLAHSGLSEHDAAIGAARAAVTVDPHDWHTHAQLANAIVASERVLGHPEAQRAASEAVRAAPDEPGAHFVAGNVAMTAGQLGPAEVSFRRALQLDPDHQEARHNLSLVQLRRNRAGQAAAGLMDVLATDSDNELALHNLRVVAANMLRIAHIGLWIIVIAVARADVWLSDEHPYRRVPWLAPVAGALAVAGLVTFGWRMRTQTGPKFGSFVRGVARVDRLLAAWAVLLIVVAVVVIAAAFVPPDQVINFYLIAALASAAGVVLSWVRVRRLNRRLKQIRTD